MPANAPHAPSATLMLAVTAMVMLAATLATAQPSPSTVPLPLDPTLGKPPQPVSAPAPPSPWIQIRAPLPPQPDAAPIELWIYAPRHRPLHSLLPYLPLFPSLTFNHAGNGRGMVTVPAQVQDLGGNGGASGFWNGFNGSGMNGGGPPALGGWNGSWASLPPNPSTNTSTSAWPEMAATGSTWPSAASMGSVSGAFPGGWPMAPSNPSYNTQPFSGSAATIADPPFLVVRGHAADIDVFRAFVERVDVPVPEVQLRVFVLEVRDVQIRSGAIQLLLNLLDGHLGAAAGSPVTEGNRLFLGGRDLSLAVSRLTGDSRVRLVSSPTLRAADGSTASVTIGTDTPTLGSIVTFSGSTQQSITYQSAGVLLNVSPHILNDTIRLMIWQELSSFARTETGLTATPTKLRRAFRTDVVARHGEVILLGGLSESSQTDNRERGLFGLGSRSSESATSEVVVLLQVLRL